MRLTYAHAHTHSPFAASSACLAASLRGDPVFMLQVHIGVCVEESRVRVRVRSGARVKVIVDQSQMHTQKRTRGPDVN